MKCFSIDMAVEVPDSVTEDEMVSKFMAFVESNRWTCGGGIQEMPEDDGTKVIDTSDPRHVDYIEK